MNDVEPKDRDIALVFQNYALYPHMTVYNNMALALKLRKVPKDEIDKKFVTQQEFLILRNYWIVNQKLFPVDRDSVLPWDVPLSREPKVFLMDEPLSNLDAKLRVQMRSEISSLHQRLGATIIYVTHDQTEAMTLGYQNRCYERRCVIMQVDSPQKLYNEPNNLFVAGFIGSPQMNFMDCVCKIEGDKVT